MTTYLKPQALGKLKPVLKGKVRKTPEKPLTSAQKKIQKAKAEQARRVLHARVQRILSPFPKHQTEVYFHPTRQWRLDYAWPEIKLGLEIHGGVHTGGRHTRGKGFIEDRAKMNEATLHGWLVLEAAPDNLKNLHAWIEAAMKLRGHLCTQ